jgi:hypothetical protein
VTQGGRTCGASAFVRIDSTGPVWYNEPQIMNGIVFTQVGTFFLIMVAGILAGRFRVIDEHTNKYLSKLLIYVNMPLLIISSFQDME